MSTTSTLSVARRRLALGAALLAAAAGSATRLGAQVIGVTPLAVDARDTLLVPLSYGLADLLATDLARSRRLTLVERARLAEVLREQELATRVAVDSATAPRAGRLLKASTLVTGSIARQPGGDVVFLARLNDVATTRTIDGFDARAPLDDILAAEKELVFKLFDRLGVQLTPQERAAVEQRPTRSLAALVAYGQAVRAEVNGQYAAAARAFRRAASVDPSFRLAATRAAQVPLPNGGAAALALSGVNRPLETVPVMPRPGLATDPAFPGGSATITITFTRP